MNREDRKRWEQAQHDAPNKPWTVQVTPQGVLVTIPDDHTSPFGNQAEIGRMARKVNAALESFPYFLSSLDTEEQRRPPTIPHAYPPARPGGNKKKHSSGRLVELTHA